MIIIIKILLMIIGLINHYKKERIEDWIMNPKRTKNFLKKKDKNGKIRKYVYPKDQFSDENSDIGENSPLKFKQKGWLNNKK